MRSDDEFDDFSHLPTVDASPSADEKHRLWKTHSRRPAQEVEPHRAPEPHHDHRQQEALEQQVLRHELPVEQEFVESHAVHAPEWAEESLGIEEPSAGEAPSIAERSAPAEPPDWVREAFGVQPQPDSGARDRSATNVFERAVDEAKEPSPPKSPSPPDRPAVRGPATAPRDRRRERSDDEAPSNKSRPQTQQERTEFRKEPAADGIADRAKPPTSTPAKTHEPADGKEQKQASLSPEIHAEEPPPEESRKRRLHALYEKIGIRGLAWSLGVHVLLLAVAAIVVVTTVVDKQVDFLPGGGSQSAADASASLQHKVQAKKATWFSRKPPMKRVVSISDATAVTLPEAPPDVFDMPDRSSLLDTKSLGGKGLGTSGMGGGFGMGMGLGGKLTFLGNTATGRRVVYAVDVSGSMSAPGPRGENGRVITRFDLLKQELVRSLNRMPVGTEYQVLYFSDFAWPHNELNARDSKAWEKYRWEITPQKTSVNTPRFRYLKADMMTLLRSRDIIEDSDNPGGTNWGSGLFMALRGTPKPDIIFFMTDGNKSDAVGWVDAVTEFNHRSGKPARIYTTAMMEPDAAEELDQLAKRNGGNFTVVMSDGTILTSDEFFKKGGGS